VCVIAIRCNNNPLHIKLVRRRGDTKKERKKKERKKQKERKKETERKEERKKERKNERKKERKKKKDGKKERKKGRSIDRTFRYTKLNAIMRRAVFFLCNGQISILNPREYVMIWGFVFSFPQYKYLDITLSRIRGVCNHSKVVLN
jgi:hypothetical protein